MSEEITANHFHADVSPMILNLIMIAVACEEGLKTRFLRPRCRAHMNPSKSCRPRTLIIVEAWASIALATSRSVLPPSIMRRPPTEAGILRCYISETPIFHMHLGIRCRFTIHLCNWQRPCHETTLPNCRGQMENCSRGGRKFLPSVSMLKFRE
jgi:hypothetical protein